MIFRILAGIIVFLAYGALAPAQIAAPYSAPAATGVSRLNIIDWRFVALTSGQAAVTVLDVESGYRALARCGAGCYEADPVARFLYAGRPAGYGVYGALTAAVARGTYELKKKGTRWWWVPAAISMGIHAYAAQHNFRLAR